MLNPSLFPRPLVALALAAAALAAAPVALAADPPNAAATVPDAAARAVLAEDADAGHTTALAPCSAC
ncbi:hypothetical protein SAMN05428960_1419 [Mitsuaria sp. PDC51]|uniref:hypothetical protein n=1 Tax=Mitsuaria sp. PDC51 TaxID=1881035 RepID=UPI0008ED2496|nr:hypothetical protein [Mitsuaria sp. PDC51]SFR77262.1 hypothetical protein SAMN05428960_1419 [Mitsuaria sp. PDC51]